MQCAKNKINTFMHDADKADTDKNRNRIRIQH